MKPTASAPERPPLAATDYELLLVSIARLQACGSVAALGREGFAAIGSLIPADLIGITWLPPSGHEGLVKLVSKSSPLLRRVQRYFERHADLHPIKRAFDAGRVGEAIRLSDVIAPREWRRHPIHVHCDRPLGHRHTLALLLPEPPRGALALSLDRKRGGDFSERDKTLLEKLAPHLAQVLRRVSLADRKMRPWREAVAQDYLATRLGLGNREAEALLHLADGHANAEIARRMNIAAGTVRKHLENAYRKLGVRGRFEAIRRVTGEIGVNGS